MSKNADAIRNPQHAVHLDPRTKLTLTILATVTIFAQRQMWAVAVAFSGVFVVVLALRLGMAWLNLLRLAAPTALLLVALGWLTGTLDEGILSALRLLAIFSVFFVFSQTMPPEDLGGALRQAGAPYPVAFIFSAALRFVPVLAQRAAEVRDAQRARGIQLEGWGWLTNAQALFAPMLIQAFKLADDLGEAMGARGFGAAGRTSWAQFRMRAWDWAGIAAGMLVCGLLVWYAIQTL